MKRLTLFVYALLAASILPQARTSSEVWIDRFEIKCSRCAATRVETTFVPRSELEVWYNGVRSASYTLNSRERIGKVRVTFFKPLINGDVVELRYHVIKGASYVSMGLPILSAQTKINLQTQVQGTLPSANGGTGTASWIAGRCVQVNPGGTALEVASAGCNVGAEHNILSATHTDSTAASAVRGDILTAQGVSPLWTRLPKGTQYQVLLAGTNEPIWSAVSLDQATAVTGLLGLSNGGTNQGTWVAGRCVQVKADGLGLESASASCASSVTAHNMLSATHSDSTAGTVVRGDIITGQGASPTWTRLAKGTQYQVLLAGTNEPVWSAVALDQATAVTGTLPGANGGTGSAYVSFTGPVTAQTYTLPAAGATLEYQANKNAASGYAGLTAGSKINAAQMQEVIALADLSDITNYVGPTQGGTGATNAATSGRYLKGNGTAFVTSAGSASGIGTCTAQFVRALNSDAGPTCQSITDADVPDAITVHDKGGAVYNVKANGAVGDGSTDDTTAIQNTINSVVTAGKGVVFIPPGTYKTTADLTVTASNVAIIGVPGQSIIKPTKATGDIKALYVYGSAVDRTTVSANVRTWATRADGVVNSITVVSATGIAADDYLLLRWRGTYEVAHIARVKSVVSTTITFYDPVTVPMDTTHTQTVQEITPVSNITVSGLVFDGSGSTTTGQVIGLAMYYTTASLVADVNFKNINQGTASVGATFWQNYRNTYRNVSSYNSGTTTSEAVNYYYETMSQLEHFYGEKDYFPLTFNGHLCTINGFVSSESTRAIRINNASWNTISNVQALNADTGLSIAWGSYRNTISNVTALLNDASGAGGVWFANSENIYNVVNNVQTSGNAHGVIFYAGDNYNTVTNWSGKGDTTGWSDAGAGNVLKDALQFGGVGNTACTGTASAGATLIIKAHPAGVCTNTSGSVDTEMRVPMNGKLRNLRAYCGTGGVNASSGVVTLYSGGVSSGITCTLGTGTSCSDLANTKFLAVGESVQVRMTTQAAETLANCNFTFEY